jgi:hypothetical protein
MKNDARDLYQDQKEDLEKRIKQFDKDVTEEQMLIGREKVNDEDTHLVFLLDESGSMQRNWRTVKESF